ncbi:hypothetical protein DV451_004898 [Geotrichum candidum]|uniref:Mitochondrial carrier n=1 Tax=Geotrichum candidum TaxID=1173061 RepID=A0A9P5FYW1_GEOCN|nr:hypothetical protein DV451_004898 [Geotrichum candidum]KAF5107887.1 hypothetical protein DV453_002768 [Geotrichum candidum]
MQVMLSGGIGGLVGDSVMYPLDTVKTRQQGAPNQTKYRSTPRAFLNVIKEEGIFRGLYGGYSPAALGSFPATLTFFLTYESTKRFFINQWGVPDSVAFFTSGLLGDLASSFIYVPSEVLKTRLQLQGRYNNPFSVSAYNYKGMNDAYRTIVRTEGYRALFYGYKATLIRDLPFSAIQFAFYEKFHSLAQTFVGAGNDMGVGLELLTGGIAGGLAGAITTPLDVVKTRIQTQSTEGVAVHTQPPSPPAAAAAAPSKAPTSTRNSNSGQAFVMKNQTDKGGAAAATAGSAKQYSISSSATHSAARAPVILTDSALSGLKIIYKTEGFGGLFSGIGPRIVWTSVQSSVMLLVYQSVLKILEENKHREEQSEF